MPAEVIDLISDFVMDHNPTSSSRPLFDPFLEQKVRSLQSLRHTCRQLVRPLPRISLFIANKLFSITIRFHGSISSPSSMLNVTQIVVTISQIKNFLRS